MHAYRLNFDLLFTMLARNSRVFQSPFVVALFKNIQNHVCSEVSMNKQQPLLSRCPFPAPTLSAATHPFHDFPHHLPCKLFNFLDSQVELFLF
mmetsp:Transcript_10279/g.15730  ORF Transcript_10279/g.15730 Transcript_10279/m.15730 type:complete len:93 (+) Transcript_10279:106-384(+)